MHLLIDGDIIAYTAAYSIEHTIYEVHVGSTVFSTESASRWREYVDKNCQDKEWSLIRTRRTNPVEDAFLYINKKMKEIYGNFIQPTCCIYFSGSDNFRERLGAMYKSNREETDKPIFLEDVKSYIASKWPTVTVPYIEADDALGILAGEEYDLEHGNPDSCERIIVTNDKDLDTVPGHHYNPITGEKYWLDEDDAEYNFWVQMLVGDSADNIKGAHGIGKTKAAKALGIDPELWPQTVWDLYLKTHSNDLEAEEAFQLNKMLLGICQHVDDIPVISEEEREEVRGVLYGTKKT